MNVLEAK